jgi:ABC-2 type transport system ATP-binding protein
LNFIFPTSGQLKILGKDCTHQSDEIKKICGYVPSEVRYYGNVRVNDLLSYSNSFHPNTDRNKMKKLCDLFEVDLKKRLKELSTGNKKKVAIVQALAHSPQLVILDEPTAGLDPLMQSRLLETLKEENKNGATIFFSSHNLSEVQNFCKKVAIIKQGAIVDIKDLTSSIDSITLLSIFSKADLSELKKLNGVLRFDQHDHVFTVEYAGMIDPVIKLLATYPIEHIEISKLGIEETFMKYYD